MKQEKIYTIGISGGTGCGKSSVIEKLCEKFKGEVCVMNLDSYYKEHHNLTYEERTKLNYDAPDSFDIDLFIDHIKKLQNWEVIKSPVYDYTIHDRSDETIEVTPQKLLIVDGIFCLVYDELRSLLDLKVFIDVDADERILRRVKRDMEVRARSLDSVMTQYLTTVKPMHEKYVAPTKNYADIVVTKGASNEIAINLLIDHISATVK